MFELGHQIADFADGNRVNTGKRFVEQDEIRLAGKGTGYFQTTALTAGKSNCGRFAQVGYREFGQQFFQSYGYGLPDDHFKDVIYIA